MLGRGAHQTVFPDAAVFELDQGRLALNLLFYFRERFGKRPFPTYLQNAKYTKAA